MERRAILVLTFILYTLVVQSSGGRLTFDDRLDNIDEGYRLGKRLSSHESAPDSSQRLPSVLKNLIHSSSANSSTNKLIQETQTDTDSSSPSASDPCDVNPCENEGICILTGPMSYECKCVGPWRGTHCSIVDACYDSPCENGGICLNVYDDYWCQCPNDYYGVNCQKKYSNARYSKTNCRPNLCHSGECISYKSGYYCECPKDRYGDHCERRISKRELSDIQYYRDLLRQLKRNMARNGGKNNENTDHHDDVAIYDAKNGIYF